MSETLRPSVDTLTPVEKYFLGNRENLQQIIQMNLSKTVKIFFQFFTAFLKSSFNLKHFEKKHESHCLCLSKIMDSEVPAYRNV